MGTCETCSRWGGMDMADSAGPWGVCLLLSADHRKPGPPDPLAVLIGTEPEDAPPPYLYTNGAFGCTHWERDEIGR